MILFKYVSGKSGKYSTATVIITRGNNCTQCKPTHSSKSMCTLISVKLFLCLTNLTNNVVSKSA